MLRIVFAIIIGIIVFALGFTSNPYSDYKDVTPPSSVTEAFMPFVYMSILSLVVGFVTAILADKYRLICAVAPVVFDFLLLALIVFSATTTEMAQSNVGPLVIVCAMCLFWAGLGGVITELLKIRLPFKI